MSRRLVVTAVAMLVTFSALGDFAPRLAPPAPPAAQEETLDVQLGSSPGVELAALIRRIRSGQVTAACVNAKRGNTLIARFDTASMRKMESCNPSYCPCACTLANDECLTDCAASQGGSPANCDFQCRPSYDACMLSCCEIC